MKTLFCIWGQMRASKTSGPNYKKYLFNKTDDDVIICCNSITKQDIELDKHKSLLYGKTIETIIYYKDINELRKEINTNNIYNNNISSDSSLQILYNGYVLKNKLQNINLDNYRYIVFIRSDGYFIQPIINFDILSPNFIYTYKGHGNGAFFYGKWLCPAIVPKNLVFTFLNSHSINIFNNNQIQGRNIESSVYNNLIKNNVKFSFININIIFITCDGFQEKTYCGKIEYDSNRKLFFKYPEIYNDSIQHIGKNIIYKNINNIIEITNNIKKYMHSPSIPSNKNMMRMVYYK
jgi:hypothetical protein